MPFLLNGPATTGVHDVIDVPADSWVIDVPADAWTIDVPEG